MGHRTNTDRCIIWWIVISLAGEIIAECNNNKTFALSASILHSGYCNQDISLADYFYLVVNDLCDSHLCTVTKRTSTSQQLS